MVERKSGKVVYGNGRLMGLQGDGRNKQTK